VQTAEEDGRKQTTERRRKTRTNGKNKMMWGNEKTMTKRKRK
jgi:hypothetical protein